MSPEQNVTFMPHFAPHSTQSWPTDPNAFQPPQICNGDMSHFAGIGSPTTVTPSTAISSSSNNVISTAISPPSVGFGGNTIHEPEIAGDCRLQEHLPQSVTQPSYYVVTGELLGYPSLIFRIRRLTPNRSGSASSSPSHQYNVTSIKSHRTCPSGIFKFYFSWHTNNAPIQPLLWRKLQSARGRFTTTANVTKFELPLLSPYCSNWFASRVISQSKDRSWSIRNMSTSQSGTLEFFKWRSSY